MVNTTVGELSQIVGKEGIARVKLKPEKTNKGLSRKKTEFLTLQTLGIEAPAEGCGKANNYVESIPGTFFTAHRSPPNVSKALAWFHLQGPRELGRGDLVTLGSRK